MKEKQYFNPRAQNDWSKDDTKFGQKLLEKMGWKKGQGVGLRNDGMSSNIDVRLKLDTKGLGYQLKDDKWVELETEFSDALIRLRASNDNTVTSQKVQESLESASENAKSRLHYKKFTKAKDISNYDEKDLAGILGFMNKENASQMKEEDPKFIASGTINEYFSNKKRKHLKQESLQLSEVSQPDEESKIECTNSSVTVGQRKEDTVSGKRKFKHDISSVKSSEIKENKESNCPKVKHKKQPEEINNVNYIQKKRKKAKGNTEDYLESNDSANNIYLENNANLINESLDPACLPNGKKHKRAKNVVKLSSLDLNNDSENENICQKKLRKQNTENVLKSEDHDSNSNYANKNVLDETMFVGNSELKNINEASVNKHKKAKRKLKTSLLQPLDETLHSENAFIEYPEPIDSGSFENEVPLKKVKKTKNKVNSNMLQSFEETVQLENKFNEYPETIVDGSFENRVTVNKLTKAKSKMKSNISKMKSNILQPLMEAVQLENTVIECKKSINPSDFENEGTAKIKKVKNKIESNVLPLEDTAQFKNALNECDEPIDSTSLENGGTVKKLKKPKNKIKFNMLQPLNETAQLENEFVECSDSVGSSISENATIEKLKKKEKFNKSKSKQEDVNIVDKEPNEINNETKESTEIVSQANSTSLENGGTVKKLKKPKNKIKFNMLQPLNETAQLENAFVECSDSVGSSIFENATIEKLKKKEKSSKSKSKQEDVNIVDIEPNEINNETKESTEIVSQAIEQKVPNVNPFEECETDSEREDFIPIRVKNLKSKVDPKSDKKIIEPANDKGLFGSFMNKIIEHNLSSGVDGIIKSFEDEKERLLTKYRDLYKQKQCQPAQKLRTCNALKISRKLQLLKGIQDKTIEHNFDGSNLDNLKDDKEKLLNETRDQCEPGDPLENKVNCESRRTKKKIRKAQRLKLLKDLQDKTVEHTFNGS